MIELYEFFLESYAKSPVWVIVVEILTFFLGIISIWFAKRENILAFPTGLIATVLTVFLLYRARYYGDMLINVYFSVMGVYGWYNWAKGNSATDNLQVSRTNDKEKLTGIGLFFITIVVIFAVYKGTNTPILVENYIDIFISGLFFTAMWYMALKKIENWVLYIIADAIAVPIYAYRGLGILALQYVIFTVLAIQAYIAWRKILNSH